MLRDAAQLDDRQMLLSGLERDDEFEPDAGLAFDECLRRGAWRTAWPLGPRLEARRMVEDPLGSRAERALKNPTRRVVKFVHFGAYDRRAADS